MSGPLIFDTSLRDGSQAENVSFTVQDKLAITKLLDDFGVDYIEGGWPGSNPKDDEYFKQVKNYHCRHAKITVFSSTRRPGVTVDQDANIAKTIASKADVACIFGKSWDFHVKKALRVELSENLAMIADTISYLKQHFAEVIFDLEHFFDAFKHNPDYATEVLTTAKQAGADFLVLCDTNGGTMPWEIEQIITALKDVLPAKFGIHAHNDSEVGVANSLVALKLGALMVQGTINGFGERCGNANLVSIIANAHFKMGLKLAVGQNIGSLTKVARAVMEIANLNEVNSQPFVGKSAFAHKGGIHVSAVTRDPDTYEHINPIDVGNSRRVLVSELSGNSNLKSKLAEYNLQEKFNAVELKKVLAKLKELENSGYVFEAAEASFELFLIRHCSKLPDFFEIISYRVIDETLAISSVPISQATIKYRVGDDIAFSSSEGDGPVDSLAISLRNGLANYYPQLLNSKLIDYKVRILGHLGGTDSKVRVMITFDNGDFSWVTVGVGVDVINASFIALTEGMIYQLVKTKVLPVGKMKQKQSLSQ